MLLELYKTVLIAKHRKPSKHLQGAVANQGGAWGAWREIPAVRYRTVPITFGSSSEKSRKPVQCRKILIALAWA